MSGGCAQCLMRVDGVPNVATCRVPVTAGMRLERQNALPSAEIDLLRANDFIFHNWFNHHEFLAGWPLAEQILQKVARKLSGLGVLPDRPAPVRQKAVIEEHDVVVVGAGAAGLAAAKQFTTRKLNYVLFERELHVGGRLISGAEPGQPLPWDAPARVGAEVVGLFADDGKPFLAVVDNKRLHLVFYRRLVLALGAHAMLPTFPNNDLPGVMAARAVSSLIRRYQVLPGKRIACVGEVDEARALAELITSAGGEPVAVGAEIVRAHGLRTVNAATVNPGGKVDCDIIALCGSTSPAFELARAGGAQVKWNASKRCFGVETDAHGKTANASLWVAGEMRGPMSSAAATEQGFVAAEALFNSSESQS